MPELKQEYFDVAKPISNYLDIRGKQAQNAILEQTPGWKEQDLQNDAAKIDAANMARRANAVKMALDTGDPVLAKQIFDQLSPEDAGKFSLERFADKVKLTLPNGAEIQARPDILSDMFKSQAEQPELWQDPKMVNASMAYILQNGGDYKAPGQPKTLSEMIAEAARPEAEKLTGQSKVDYLTGVERAGKKGTSVTTNVNMPGNKAFTKFGEEQAKVAAVEEKDARSAVKSLGNINQAFKLLDSPAGVITGTGAEFMTKAGNFLSSRLGIKLADDAIANTESYKAFMGKEVGQVITDFGSGTGLSDADREYAEAIAGGKIALTEKSLRLLLDINRRMELRKIEAWNEKADHIMKNANKGEVLYDPHIKIPDSLKGDKGLMGEVEKEVEKMKKTSSQKTAPAFAIEYLKQHPEAAEDFKQKYGYLP
jgi:hypothetical protein